MKTQVKEIIDNCDLQSLLNQYNAICRVLKSLGIKPTPYAYNLIRLRIEKEKIKYKPTNQAQGSRIKVNWIDKAKKESIIVSMCGFKNYLIKNNHLEQSCAICGNKPFHNNKPLVLQLDHIDGDRQNNEISNLRLLCPNCHSQTDTYTGRNLRKTKCCKLCPNPIASEYAIYCSNCKPTAMNRIYEKRETKIEWPSEEKLAKMLWEKPTIKIAKELGVSDNAVKKRAEKYGLTKPGPGYWAKVDAGKI
jgi:Zn finger protein HypA/HybF involved in hydrogenase expression